MRRREFITLLGGAAVAGWPLVVQAQERVRRVGVLSNPGADDAEMHSRTAAFAQGLQELGWTVGRNLQIDYRWSNGSAERLRAHAAELIALEPDVVLATSGVSIMPLLGASRTVPIEYLHRRSTRSASVLSRACPDREATLPVSLNLSTAFRRNGWSCLRRSRRPQPMLPCCATPLTCPDYLYYRAAGLIDKIFKGARPANLPVEQPTKLELVINLKTAKSLGQEVPPMLLARADEVIE
jgi:ABC-type uncharacterized transport system substrate-binding protein